ncbi:hypothetical protein DMN91_012483 [Ooceraea biroi]|uniref:Peptidase M1 membrane alanine aminopeptidase domain-containing protein n=1 Tax=Ooceraea biroi TaxID=2015173 RepID=A0A3L8D5I1_OOCBI|nr:hypothetical protein DMN91_012483 [Ooceraea biroi]
MEDLKIILYRLNTNVFVWMFCMMTCVIILLIQSFRFHLKLTKLLGTIIVSKQHVLRSLVDGLLQKIGFQEISHEDDLTKRLRQEARHWACVLNSTMCTEAATVELRHYMLDEPSAYKEVSTVAALLVIINNVYSAEQLQMVNFLDKGCNIQPTEPYTYCDTEFPLETTENNAFALYRVEDIIYNATLDTIYHKLEIARLVSRKVTYLWLGNAFSPFPWSYLWIGESLCTLLSMEALTQNRSELRIMDYSIGQMQHDSFHLDTHSVMNPLMMDVGPNETDALFYFQYYLKDCEWNKDRQIFPRPLTSLIALRTSIATPLVATKEIKSDTQNDPSPPLKFPDLY